MGIGEILGIGLSISLHPANLAYAFLGALIGTLVGVLPGLGPAAALALLLPVSFGLPPVGSIIMLAGMAFAVGNVVDNSIVVLENIVRHREMGKTRFQAARDGATEVWGAILASTLTNLAVFLPIVFVQDEAGQLFRDQALTVTFAMLISLVVAMTLIPMLASLKGRSPIAYKDEEPSPGWQPTNRVGRGVKRVVTPVSKTFFRWIPKAIIVGSIAKRCSIASKMASRTL